VLLGDASYALYILHVPVHEWLLYLGREHGYDGWGKLPFFYAYLVLVIPFSVLVLWTIERPVRARLRRVGRLLFS
jgi:peptidoglycan/LPS O-acetylase OafA/YrhL